MAEPKDVDAVYDFICANGKERKDGCISMKYIDIYKSPKIADKFDIAYLGTLLRSAKRQKFVHYAGAALMQGASDDLEIIAYADENKGVGLSAVEAQKKAPEPTAKVERVGPPSKVGRAISKFERIGDADKSKSRYVPLRPKPACGCRENPA
eukprot:gene502-753_t